MKTNSNITFDLIVAYIPPERTEHMKLLSDQISQNADRNIVLVGDFNAKVVNGMIQYAMKKVEFCNNK